MKLILLVLALFCPANTALADGFLIDFRLGAKGVLTGNLWSQPEKLPFDPLISMYWGDNQFGMGGGGGAFFETNILGFLALELDLIYEINSLSFNQTINGFEYDYTTQFGQVRLPLLVKGVLPLGPILELSLGIGPEFVFGTSAETKVDFLTVPSNAMLVQQANILQTSYQAQSTDGTFFTLDLGLSIKIFRLFFPIDLRLGINLDQPSSYQQRVAKSYNENNVYGVNTVKAIESYHFALLAGVGYIF